MENLDYYLIYDKPYPYKNLLFYPVLVEKYLEFMTVVECLLIEKDNIPDPKIISMSYLDFLFYYATQSEEGQRYLMYLSTLFEICLHKSDIGFVQDQKGKYSLIIDGNTYDKNDFKIFREIICKQNMIDLDDGSDLHPDVKKALEEAERIRYKNKKKMCSFEDQLVCVMLELGETDVDKISKLTVRKFFKIIERYDVKLHYIINKTAEMSGNVKFNHELDHWMSEVKKEKYSDVKVNYDEFANKLKEI